MSMRAIWSMVVFAGVTVAAQSDGKKTMKFEIFADAKDEWRWRLKDDSDTNVVNSGQGYKAKADAKKMVENLQEDISKYEFEFYEDKNMETRFRMKAKNGNVVGASTSSYKSKADAEKVVNAIKKGVKDATVTELKKVKP